MPFQNPTNLALIDSNSLGVTVKSTYSVSSIAAGDVNGDGYNDMLFGRCSSSGRQAYLVFGSSAPAAIPNLETMSAAVGIKMSGGSSGAQVGCSVAVGDVNGDGFADMLLGAPASSSTSATKAYLVFGSATPVSISNLDTMSATTGVQFVGSNGSWAGWSVAVGDVNGDGFDDILISAFMSQKVYLLFGSSSPVSVPSLDAMSASTGVIMSSSVGGRTGYSVAIGDVNGDGFSDMLIGAPLSASNYSAYLIFGSSTPVAIPELTTISATTGIILSSSFSFVGKNVAMGDFNQDGLDDMVLAGFNNNIVYVVYGQRTPVSLNLNTMAASKGFAMTNSNNDYSGSQVAIRDINGDGKADILIGSLGNSFSGSVSYKSYLVFGTSSLVSSFNLATMPAATGITLSDSASSPGWGIALSDINGDGKADMLIRGSAKVYLVYGGPQPKPVTSCTALANLNGLGTGTLAATGFQLTNGIGNAGRAVALGDVNGDGKADMLLGAYSNNQAYLVLGSSSPAAVNLGTMAAATGVLLSGGSGNAGYSVAIGDVNGDGKADMLLGAPAGNKAYLVFNSNNPVAVTNLDTMASTTGVILSGGSGNAGWSVAIGDVNGDSKADMLIGAPADNKAYLVFGSRNTTALSVSNLDTMAATTGVVLSGGSGNAGYSVAIGDVNADSKADMLLGAPAGDKAYLIVGSRNPLAISNLDSMASTTGVLINGGSGNAGWSVAIGNGNSDGKGDMLIGTQTGNQAYLVFGSRTPAAVNLGTMGIGTGVVLSGGSGQAGSSVAIGDVNGDGKSDMLIGAPVNNQVYLVFGSIAPTSVNLGAINAAAGALLSGGSGQTGFSVAIGDVNGDSKADMLIGVQTGNQAYLLLGNETPWLSNPEVSTSTVPWLTASTNRNYTVGGTPLTIGPQLALDDTSAQITGASVQITSNYVSTEDVLTAGSLPGGITSLFNSTTGTLTLTGTTTVANYQTAIEGITFTDINLVNPSLLTRTVTYQVNDGVLCGISNSFPFTINMIAPTPSSTISLSASVTRTPSHSASVTITPSLSASITPSNTVTPTSSITPSTSITPSSSVTPSVSVTSSNTITPTNSITPSASVTPSSSVTASASSTPSNTITPTSSITPSASVTITASASVTSSLTITPSETVSLSATPSSTATKTSSTTPTISLTRTVTPSSTSVVANAPPVLVNNSFTVARLEQLVLTPANILATDTNTPATQIAFTVSNVKGGYFELINSPGVALTSFTQEQINNGQIKFVQDGSFSAPTYDLTVSNGVSPAVAETTSDVTFICGSQLDSVTMRLKKVKDKACTRLNTGNLVTAGVTLAEDFNKVNFEVSNVKGGIFIDAKRCKKAKTSTKGLTSFSFKSLEDGDIAFKVLSKSKTPPSFAIAMQDLCGTTEPALSVTATVGSKSKGKSRMVKRDIEDTNLDVPVANNLSLALVLGKLASDAIDAGKRWWQGGSEVDEQINLQDKQKLTERLVEIKDEVIERLSEQDLEKWHRYSLEDLMDELNQANVNRITAEDITNWKEELAEIEEDYSKQEENVSAMKLDNSKMEFFKPSAQVAMQEQAALPQREGNLRIVQG